VLDPNTSVLVCLMAAGAFGKPGRFENPRQGSRRRGTPQEGEEGESDFFCEVNNQMPVELSTSNDSSSADCCPMRWEHSYGSGLNCHACERAWRTELSLHWKPRAEYKIDCAKVLKIHRERRQAFIARTNSSTASPPPHGSKASGVKKTSVETR